MAVTASGSLHWEGGERFTGTSPKGSPVTFDGAALEGASPVTALLLAGGACSAVDVVLILEKMQVRLTSLDVRAEGQRREEHPRRFTAIHYEFEAAGEGLDQARLERAVALSVEKYCSVLASLAPDIAITHASRVR